MPASHRPDLVDPSVLSELMQTMLDAEPAAAGLLSYLENWLGAGLDGLRIGSFPGPALLGARAFACRGTIIVEPNSFAPDTPAGMALLVHEAAHILQQAGATHATGPVRVHDDRHLEREADLAVRIRGLGRTMTRRSEPVAWLQCQMSGTLDAHYLDGGTTNPPSGNIVFAAHNSMNEVFSTRGAAFDRAKTLIGLSAESRARRTYHFWTGATPMQRELGEGEFVLGNNGNALTSAAANQRTGRYFDFGHGKLIAEHPDDPNSWTRDGQNGPQVQRGHFHCCEYDIASGGQQSMYMLPDGGVPGHRQVSGGPTVYRWARPFSFETTQGGETGHHIYYLG